VTEPVQIGDATLYLGDCLKAPFPWFEYGIDNLPSLCYLGEQRRVL